MTSLRQRSSEYVACVEINHQILLCPPCVLRPQHKEDGIIIWVHRQQRKDQLQAAIVEHDQLLGRVGPTQRDQEPVLVGDVHSLDNRVDTPLDLLYIYIPSVHVRDVGLGESRQAQMCEGGGLRPRPRQGHPPRRVG
jgi:hypothetical protein